MKEFLTAKGVPFTNLDIASDESAMNQLQERVPGATTVPVILVDEAYWTGLIRFETLLAQGFVSPGDLELMQFAVDGADAWRRLAPELAVGAGSAA